NLEQLYIDSVITYDSLTRGSCLQPFTIPEFEESAMIQPAKPLIPSDVSKVIEDWMQPQSSQNIKNNPDKNNTILYPNPAEDAVFVASKMPMRNIVIRETNGRLLHNINAQDLQVIKIDATGLVRGMYIVEIYSAGQREIKTLVISK
ncbi:MAG: T9SS type A sorting domain-containing protein, partial [Bacteroidia bacterium]|nr:T9SS type A sorting domain-containing protein [Bacteroidia bacterium]